MVNHSCAMRSTPGRMVPPTTGDSLLFPSTAMCYKLSVSLPDTLAFVRVCRRINPDLAGSYDRQTVNSEGIA